MSKEKLNAKELDALVFIRECISQTGRNGETDYSATLNSSPAVSVSWEARQCLFGKEDEMPWMTLFFHPKVSAVRKGCFDCDRAELVIGDGDQDLWSELSGNGTVIPELFSDYMDLLEANEEDYDEDGDECAPCDGISEVYLTENHVTAVFDGSRLKIILDAEAAHELVRILKKDEDGNSGFARTGDLPDEMCAKYIRRNPLR